MKACFDKSMNNVLTILTLSSVAHLLEFTPKTIHNYRKRRLRKKRKLLGQVWSNLVSNMLQKEKCHLLILNVKFIM